MLQASPATLAPVADYFKVLSEVSRLQVLCCLKSGSKNVTEVMEETGLGQANVSKHLKILAQAGIVVRRPQGISVYYEIVDPLIFKLCDLVCDRLALLLEEQSHQLQQLNGLRDRVSQK
ncbi:MAG: metalloregulator ArsR/SmtB family transcription factor [Oculatellaceae cyanobacterium bins.114]|nr:metalloregulator ArsR/SmtB family transcription factor [Oculatellaceae cyanobacterium bins.114]